MRLVSVHSKVNDCFDLPKDQTYDPELTYLENFTEMQENSKSQQEIEQKFTNYFNSEPIQAQEIKNQCFATLSESPENIQDLYIKKLVQMQNYINELESYIPDEKKQQIEQPINLLKDILTFNKNCHKELLSESGKVNEKTTLEERYQCMSSKQLAELLVLDCQIISELEAEEKSSNCDEQGNRLSTSGILSKAIHKVVTLQTLTKDQNQSVDSSRGAGLHEAAGATEPKDNGGGVGLPEVAGTTEPKDNGEGVGLHEAAGATEPKDNGGGVGLPEVASGGAELLKAASEVKKEESKPGRGSQFRLFTSVSVAVGKIALLKNRNKVTAANDGRGAGLAENDTVEVKISNPSAEPLRREIRQSQTM